jgi:hypothetical protein
LTHSLHLNEGGAIFDEKSKFEASLSISLDPFLFWVHVYLLPLLWVPVYLSLFVFSQSLTLLLSKTKGFLGICFGNLQLCFVMKCRVRILFFRPWNKGQNVTDHPVIVSSFYRGNCGRPRCIIYHAAVSMFVCVWVFSRVFYSWDIRGLAWHLACSLTVRY